MDQSEIREAMDACRAGSDDHRLPEMATVANCVESDPGMRRLFDRVQRLDKRIAEAAHDVPVPEGLAERILARLQVRRDEASNGPFVVVSTLPVVPIERALPAALIEPVVDVAWINRRRFDKWTWLAAGLAASLALAVSVVAFWPRHKPLTEEALWNDSGTWFSQLWDHPAWVQLERDSRVLANYPLTNQIRGAPRQWSDASESVGQNAVAYELSIAEGHRAALFVIPASGVIAGSSPPLKPQSSTGGLMIGWWQSQGMIYVLVVEGDERNYLDLMSSAAQPPFA